MTLEIPTELETRLRPVADAHGQTLEAFALTQLEQAIKIPSAPQTDRRARLAALRGSVKGKGPTVDEFLAERAAEAKAEAGL